MSKSHPTYCTAVVEIQQVSDFIHNLEDQGAQITDYVVWPNYQIGQVGKFADTKDAFVDVGVWLND